MPILKPATVPISAAGNLCQRYPAGSVTAGGGVLVLVLGLGVGVGDTLGDGLGEPDGEPGLPPLVVGVADGLPEGAVVGLPLFGVPGLVLWVLEVPPADGPADACREPPAGLLRG